MKRYSGNAQPRPNTIAGKVSIAGQLRLTMVSVRHQIVSAAIATQSEAAGTCHENSAVTAPVTASPSQTRRKGVRSEITCADADRSVTADTDQAGLWGLFGGALRCAVDPASCKAGDKKKWDQKFLHDSISFQRAICSRTRTGAVPP